MAARAAAAANAFRSLQGAVALQGTECWKEGVSRRKRPLLFPWILQGSTHCSPKAPACYPALTISDRSWRTSSTSNDPDDLQNGLQDPPNSLSDNAGDRDRIERYVLQLEPAP